MSTQLQTVICKRCGRAFTTSPTYFDFLARRGVRVVVPVLCPACFTKKGPLPKTRGQVKWFHPRKRYGFIATEGGEEVFFHENQLVENDGGRLTEGQKVQFHVHFPRKGPAALNVELLGEIRPVEE
jgi:CspA family cold shock protein